MLNVLWSLGMFLIVISILVAFHEYGHFIVARACGVKVTRFSIGFGKIIWSRVDKKGTEFALSVLPFGGYVKMLDERIEPVREQDKSHAFNNKSIWQRGAIVAAGPVFNFIFAIIGYWVIFMIGITNISPIVGQVQPNSIAAHAGFKAQQQIIQVNHQRVYSWQDVIMPLLKAVGTPQIIPITVQDPQKKQDELQLDLTQWQYKADDMLLFESLGFLPYQPEIPAIIGNVKANSPASIARLLPGDKITAINGQPVSQWQTVADMIQQHPDTTVTLSLLRDGQSLHQQVLIGQHTSSSNRVVGYLGVESQPFAWPDALKSVERYSPMLALQHAINKTYQMSQATLQLMGKMITGKISVKGMSGPVGIAQTAGDSAKLGLVHFIAFLSIVSLSLAVINLLPIPILDGGQLLFLIIEAIIRRPIPIQIQEIGLKIGILILLGVMLLALYNDLSRIVYS